MDGNAAQAWFIAGALPPLLAGGAHALYTLADVARPRHFAPVDPAVRIAMEETGMRFARRYGGNGARLSMWNAWLGFNISHGLGVFAFGLLCLLIAANDFELIQRVDAFRALTVAVPAVYFAVAMRFWFYGPAVITGASTVCFAVAAVLAT